MSSMIEVCDTSEFQNGDMKEVIVEGHEIFIAKVEDKYYATDNRCPHMGGILSRGNLKETVVTCPRYGSQFELNDGSVVRWLKGSGLLSKIGKTLKSPRPLSKYNIQVVDNKILVEV